jgi:hypothetical protein
MDNNTQRGVATFESITGTDAGRLRLWSLRTAA